jgi:hypothetical protein
MTAQATPAISRECIHALVFIKKPPTLGDAQVDVGKRLRLPSRRSPKVKVEKADKRVGLSLVAAVRSQCDEHLQLP